MIKKTTDIVQENFRGGEGKITICHILQGEELRGHATMFSKIVLPPGSSIGWHTHETNSEPFYILKGTALFKDNDGTETLVHPGDVCNIEVGQSHSIANAGDEDLEIIALVYPE